MRWCYGLADRIRCSGMRCFEGVELFVRSGSSHRGGGGVRVWGLGFRGLGFRVWGLGVRARV